VDKSHHFSTEFGDYVLSNVVYNGRQARVLYSGDRQSAQSGIPLDDSDEMLFDYNERFMELAGGLCPTSVLLIGGGSYTLPAALLRQNPELELDVVEPDAKLEEVAKRYFDYRPGPRTQSFAMGGAAFLDQCQRTYDLILIDAFVNDKVPDELRTTRAAEQLRRVLKPDGLLAMNIISASQGSRSGLLERQRDTFASVFGRIEIFPAGHESSQWMPQNFVLCAGQGSPGNYLRYPGIELRKPFSDIFAADNTDSTT
jgi:spermidine synthase